MNILTEPKNALSRQYKRLFEMDGVQLTITDDALRAVAHKAIERKTGARGLRAIMEDIMQDVMYDIPSQEGIVECQINADVINKTAAPLLIHAPEELTAPKEELTEPPKTTRRPRRTAAPAAAPRA